MPSEPAGEFVDSAERRPTSSSSRVLFYGIAPRRRRWLTYGISLILIAAALRFAVAPIQRQWERWQANRTLLHGVVPADGVAMSGQWTWGNSRGGRHTSSRHPKGKALHAVNPGFVGRRNKLVFAHERIVGGQPYLVLVAAVLPSTVRTGDRLAIDLVSSVARTGQPNAVASTTTVAFGLAGEEGEWNLDLLTGQPDPQDSALFTIPLYLQDYPGRITGRIESNGSVSFDLSGIPNVPPAAFYAPPRTVDHDVHEARLVRPPPP